MADQQFIDALHEQDKIDQLIIDLNLAQYDNAVLSVNGKTGAVVLSTTDVAEGTRLYYTNARVDARLSGLIDDLLTATDRTWSSTKIADAILNGAVETATKWASPMSYTFSGDVVGSGSFDGSTGITVNATVPGKVNNNRVLTDVPAGAVFTDTLYDDSPIWNAVNLNTGKVGITQAQADAIDLNTAKYSYPPADSSKLSLIEAQAQKNVQSDWDQTNTTRDDYIKNKPSTGTGDMLKSTYDTNDSGIVDNTEALGGDAPDLFAKLSSPAFTGDPTAPTPGISANNNYIATTAFVKAAVHPNVQSDWDQTNDLQDDYIKNKPDSGAGDMEKSVYDTNDSGVVDNSEKVNDLTVQTAVPVGAKFTDTIYDDTTIQAEVDLNTDKITYDDAALVEQHTTDISEKVNKSGDTMTGNLELPSLTVNGGAVIPTVGRNIFCDGEVGRINQSYFDGNWGGISNNEYGYDIWKKVNTSTISQTIEEGNFYPSTEYTLSGNNVTTSQITSPSSGNWTVSIPNNASFVQLEKGSTKTAFEDLPYGVQLSRVQRYYEEEIATRNLYPYILANGSVNASYPRINITYKQTKRVSPAVSVTMAGTSPAAEIITTDSFVAVCQSNASNSPTLNSWVADARL